ncbi:MAG: hypothetical protein ABSD50_02800 [Smithella sp.]|jgi:predicted DNA-binding protein YlxM (UPF0122 family)
MKTSRLDAPQIIKGVSNMIEKKESKKQSKGKYLPTNHARQIDIGEAIQLRLINRLTFQQIAYKYGVTRQSIQQRIKAFIDILGDPEISKAYEENRAKVMTNIERVLAGEMLDKKKLKKATTGNIAYAIDKIHNVIRLERNQSTGNQQIIVKVIRFGDLKPEQISDKNAKVEGKSPDDNDIKDN